MPAPCEQMRPLLPALAADQDGDGLEAELGAVRAAELRVHLLDCAGCRAEAGGFLRAGRALRTIAHSGATAGSSGAASGGGTAAAAPIDDTLQADLHRQIMARVAAIDWHDGLQTSGAAHGPGVLGFARLRRELAWHHVAAFAGAAALLVAIGFWAFGFWLDDHGGRVSIWDRRPVHASSHGPLRAVPYSGPRVELLPVGLPIDEFGSAENGVGPGMMGRGRLRTQIDEEFVLPVVVPVKR